MAHGPWLDGDDMEWHFIGVSVGRILKKGKTHARCALVSVSEQLIETTFGNENENKNKLNEINDF